MVSIQQSIQQFGHPEFILRLFLSLSLAVGCSRTQSRGIRVGRRLPIRLPILRSARRSSSLVLSGRLSLN